MLSTRRFISHTTYTSHCHILSLPLVLVSPSLSLSVPLFRCSLPCQHLLPVSLSSMMNANAADFVAVNMPPSEMRAAPPLPQRPHHEYGTEAAHKETAVGPSSSKNVSVSRLLVLLVLCLVALMAAVLAYTVRSLNQLVDIHGDTQSLWTQGNTALQMATNPCVCSNSVAAHQPAEPFQLEPSSPRLSSSSEEYDPTFDFNQFHVGFVNTSWGFTHPANLDNWPSLQGVAISQNLFQLEVEGSNSPHHHPDAVEMLFVIEGVINVTRVEPNGGATFSHTLHGNMSVFFPRGHIHFQHNIGNTVARYISTLNAELPGVMSEAQRLCDLPADAILSMFAEQTADSVTKLCGSHDDPGLPINIIHYIHGQYDANRKQGDNHDAVAKAAHRQWMRKLVQVAK